MEDRSPDITHSDLCRIVTRDDVTVTVEIYRLGQDRRWVLEVVNQHGTATLWDDPFDTEQEALDVFEQTLEVEGIETFLVGSDAETLH